jgi:hypothetical protein
VVLLFSLHHLVEIDHEPLLGTRRPDILATLRETTPIQKFVADIATVFETGRNEQNPVEPFADELWRQARKLNLDPNRFRLEIASEKVGDGSKQITVLRIPSRPEFATIFKRYVIPFLSQCATSPDKTNRVDIKEENAQITVTFDPANRFFSRSHSSFTALDSLDRNPIYNVLRRKARQLRDTQYSAPRGVFLCAADAQLGHITTGTYTVPDIIDDVFRQNSAISFIHTLWISDVLNWRRGELISELYINPHAEFPLPEATVEVLKRVIVHLPKPVNSGLNALYEIQNSRFRRGRYFLGSFSMSSTEVKISVRVLMEVLAGRLSVEEFHRLHGGDRGLVPLFEQKLRRGQLLRDVTIEEVQDRDDDWIVFKFSPPSPAGGPIRL